MTRQSLGPCSARAVASTCWRIASAAVNSPCSSCREAIPKGAWRIALVYYEEGRFEPSGYIHVACATNYFETADILDRVRHFSKVTDAELAEIGRELAG